jgi:hypothetical protein
MQHIYCSQHASQTQITPLTTAVARIRYSEAYILQFANLFTQRCALCIVQQSIHTLQSFFYSNDAETQPAAAYVVLL